MRRAAVAWLAIALFVGVVMTLTWSDRCKPLTHLEYRHMLPYLKKGVTDCDLHPEDRQVLERIRERVARGELP